MFQYVIGDSDFKRVDVINDLGVLVDSRMSIAYHIESMVSKSAIMLGFIKWISREFNDSYTYKTLYVAFVRLGLEYASFGEDLTHSTQLYKICTAKFGLNYSTSASLWKQMPLVGAGGSEW
jgi:hypothetical protein